ncbi:MAG TPA: hypothetical protein VMV05_09675, partial [bacterium]|nr:hypothetical protein [bacterium]
MPQKYRIILLLLPLFPMVFSVSCSKTYSVAPLPGPLATPTPSPTPSTLPTPNCSSHPFVTQWGAYGSGNGQLNYPNA